MQTRLGSAHQGLQYLGDHMSGRYQIYVVAALYLKVKHDVCQLFRAHRTTLAKLAYGVVLTENTAQIAPGEEYRP